jgi:hypothetical protein
MNSGQTLGVVLGDQVWIAIAVAAALGLAVSLRWRRVTSPWGVLRWFLQCWAGRGFALSAWAIAGWHLFCQRP